MIKAQDGEQRKYIEPSSSAGADRAAYYKDQKAKSQSLKIWKVSDKCMAKDATNGQFYEATIEAITDDGDVSVIFDTYQNKGQTNVKELKEYKVRVEVFPQNNNKRVRPNHRVPEEKEAQEASENGRVGGGTRIWEEQVVVV